jgi:protein involved in polysaccharide export with SLBB domain
MSTPARHAPRLALWGGLLALALALCPPAEAQGALSREANDLASAAQAARAAQVARRSLDRAALEGALDPASYLVGPGDVFTVSIGGAFPRQTEVIVSADGTLAVPEAGSFRVTGRPLGAVQSEVGAALAARYRNVPTDVTLASPREFYVHVSGAVPLPGRQLLNAVARVSDALELAAGGVSARALAEYDRLTTPVAPEDDLRSEEELARLQQQRINLSLANATVQQRALAERGDVWPDARRLPALRSVRVTHRDGAETRVDLVRYFATGDVSANPVLRDGDTVYLPTFDPVREGVPVSGAVDRPGVYDVRPGDTALDLLVVATGRDGLDRLRAVRLTRAGGAGTPIEVPIADAAALAVAPRDQVFGVEANPDAGLAEVIGAVAFPGVYPITVGETTLDDLVALAGGLGPTALARGAYLERRARALPAAVAGEETTLSDLDLFGRQFVTAELARTPRRPVDLAGDAPAVRVLDGDRLVVPRDVGGVRVFGQVSEPGFVAFAPGRTAAAYVEEAGGPGPGATETYVVEAGTGRLVRGAGAEVRQGDAVFVDRTPTAEDPTLAQLVLQEERAELEVARDRRQFLFQTISTTVVTLGFLITTYFQISNN